jgi:myosin-5
MYWDDKYSTETVSHEVLAAMKAQMAELDSQLQQQNSFLLDDDAVIPFTSEEMAVAIGSVEVLDVPLPAGLREQPAFAVLEN